MSRRPAPAVTVSGAMMYLASAPPPWLLRAQLHDCWLTPPLVGGRRPPAPLRPPSRSASPTPCKKKQLPTSPNRRGRAAET
jgi:hypothetical protein